MRVAMAGTVIWCVGVATLIATVSAVHDEYAVKKQDVSLGMANSFGMVHKTAQYESLTARLVPDDFCCSEDANSAVCKANAVDCGKGSQLKELRAIKMLHVTQSELRTAFDNDNIFSGPLSGWQAFPDLKISQIFCEGTSSSWVPFRPNRLKETLLEEDFSEYHRLVGDKDELKAVCGDISFRLMVRFHLPAWTGNYVEGWHVDKPGFAFWLSAQPTLSFGVDISTQAGGQKASRVHMYAHQYKSTAGLFNPITAVTEFVKHHAGILIEWADSPGYTTVYEVAWRNGLSGYKGQSNYFPRTSDDSMSHESINTLFEGSPGLHQPWISSLSEIRIIDIDHASDVNAFLEWMEEEPAFENPTIAFSAAVLLEHNSRKDIHEAVLNSINSDGAYREGGIMESSPRNCQTWASDFYTHLTGEDATITGHNAASNFLLGKYLRGYVQNTQQFL